MCENPAPVEAYYAKEEIEKMEIDQQRAIEAQIQKEEELRASEAVRQAEGETLDQPSEVKDGSLDVVKYAELSNEFLNRNIVFSAFNSINSSILRLRRYGYSSSYVRKWIKTDKIENRHSLYLGGHQIAGTSFVNTINMSYINNEEAIRKLDNEIPRLNNAWVDSN